MATAMTLCAPRAGQRIHREDVYMPLTPMFHALAWGFPFIAVTLRAHLLRQVESNRISKYAVPEIDRIAFVPEIPKTSVGKIDKKVLRAAQRVTTAGRLRAGRSGPGAHRVARTASPPPRI
jgi:acyl-CoA synthetase (AMP-forming)/AMP-acid ligase II